MITKIYLDLEVPIAAAIILKCGKFYTNYSICFYFPYDNATISI